MMPRLIFAVLMALLVTLDVVAAERTWTDVQGRSMRAEFVRELDGEVTLLRAGKLVTIPLQKFSEKDRQYIRDVADGKSAAEEPAADSPPPPVSVPVPPSPAPPARDAASEDTAASDPFESSSKPAASSVPAEAPPAASSKSTKRFPPAANRAWADSMGNVITAKFVRMFGRKVVLMRGVRTSTVLYDQLSPADKQYLEEFLTERGLESQIPPPLPMNDGAAEFPGAQSQGPPSEAPTASGLPAAIQSGRDLINQRMEEARQRSEEQQAEEQRRAEEQNAEQVRAAAERQAAYQAEQEAARARLQEDRERQAEEQRQRQEEFAANQPAGRCSKCFRSISKTEAEGTHCPHCNTRWSFKEVDGKKELIAGAGAELVSRGIFMLVLIIAIALGALAVFVAIVVAIVRSIASAGSNNRRRQYY